MRKYLIITAFLGLPGPALAAPIQGSVDVSPLPWADADTPNPPGYVRLPVSAPAPAFERRFPASALFLQVVESLPITPREGAFSLRLAGGRLQPEVVACAVDEILSFTNEEEMPVEIRVGEAKVGPIASGASAEWICSASSEGATLKPIRVEQLPWVRASVFVGEVGVAALPDRNGSFEMSAPKGRYQLLWIGRRGVLERREVTVAERRVELRPFVREEETIP